MQNLWNSWGARIEDGWLVRLPWSSSRAWILDIYFDVEGPLWSSTNSLNFNLSSNSLITQISHTNPKPEFCTFLFSLLSEARRIKVMWVPLSYKKISFVSFFVSSMVVAMVIDVGGDQISLRNEKSRWYMMIIMMWVWVKTMERKEILKKKVKDIKGKVAAVGGRRRR